jgi:hypothetical protein
LAAEVSAAELSAAAESTTAVSAGCGRSGCCALTPAAAPANSATRQASRSE